MYLPLRQGGCRRARVPILNIPALPYTASMEV